MMDCPEMERDSLREQAGMFRTIIENTFDLVSLIDVQGRYIYCNPAYTRTLGYPAEEMVGRSAFAIVHPDERGKAEALFQEGLDSGQVSSAYTRLRLICRDGTVKVVDHRARLITDPGARCKQILLIASDVTGLAWAQEERKRLEEQLRQSHKLESVGRLAGGVAHDFNNMLGVILGHVEMALESVGENHELYPDLEEIQKAALRSAELTRQLLAFARKQTISPRILDVNQTIAGMLKMLRRLIGENVELVWKPGTDLWPVYLDPVQLDQILANLAVNARDAIGEVGELILQTGNIALDETYCRDNPQCLAGDYVLISVSDTGCGMSPEILEHVFEPFFSTKQQGQGTGLGLATVYGIVHQNHGYITVYSELNLGTTFNIYLPRHSDEAALAQSKASTAQCRGDETILLVEDELSVLNLGQTILERLGYRVLTAASPAQALTVAQETSDRIDLLISDIVMPAMNGRQLFERLRCDHPRLTCLLMSGYGPDLIPGSVMIDAGEPYLQKPFSVQDLVVRVRRILDDRQKVEDG